MTYSTTKEAAGTGIIQSENGVTERMTTEYGKVIQFPIQEGFIDTKKLRSNVVKLQTGLIAPASEEVESVVVTEHAAEPIKDMDTIFRISDFLISNRRWRDNMLFIVGINFGLRVSDLLMLRFCDLITPELLFKETFAVFEKKTRNTRSKKRNRYITVNEAAIDAVTLYLQNTPGIKLSDYMFRSEATNSQGNIPLTRQAVDKILKGIARDLDLNIRFSTHSLRKTFGFWQMAMGGNDPRRLLLLQKMFGHSTAAQTLDYIGITEDEIKGAYLGLNLGHKDRRYLIDSKIGEAESLLA